MTKLKALVAVIGLTALIAIGAACGDGEEPTPAQAPASTLPLARPAVADTPVPPTTGVSEPSSGPVTSTMLAPRPETIEVLVRMSHIIVLGTISGVLDEKLIGAYGDDGNPYVPVEESGSPFTDYEVRVESVLKNDGDVEDGGTLVLRMVGHLSRQNDLATLAVVTLPQPGAHYLLALGRNPDRTYGSGSEGLIYVDGETVAYVDGIPFSTKLAGEEFVETVRQEVDQAQGQPGPSGSPGANTSPVIPAGAPLLNLTYEGAVYYASALSTDEAGNLNENDLELIGAATESNLLLPAGSDIRRFIVDLSHDNPALTLSEIKDRVEAKFQIGLDNSTVGRTLQGLNIYELKHGEEGYVYTFTPGHSMVNPEDGQIFEFQPEWMRWAAAD